MNAGNPRNRKKPEVSGVQGVCRLASPAKVVVKISLAYLRAVAIPCYLVAQQIPSPPAPNISVRDFGAIPNDGKDHTIQIQAAIDAARKGSIKTVLFPAGEYMVSSVGITPGLTLWGYGATIKMLPMQPDGTRMFDTEGSYLYVGATDSLPLVMQGFTFDGNRMNQGSYQQYQLEHQAGIFLMADGFSALRGRLVVKLQDINFQETAGDGVDINVNVNISLKNITAINCFREGIGVGGGNNIVDVDTFTSSGDEGFTGFHVEGAPGELPSIVTAQNFRLQGNFTAGLKNGSTLTATNIVSGSPWVVSAPPPSKMTISNSSLGGGPGLLGVERGSVLFPGNVQFSNVDFYGDDLTVPPKSGVGMITSVAMNTNNTSWTAQRLQFINCHFHLPRTGKPAWPMAAVYDGGDQLVRDNRITLRNCTIDPGITYGFYGNNGGKWDVESSSILADSAVRLKYSIINGIDYFWDVVMQNITPSIYSVKYADIQPYISNGVVPHLTISGLTSGGQVSGSTVITYGGSTPVTPQCSVDGGTWTGCTSGITTLAQLPAWYNIPVGSTFTLYLRDLTAGGVWGTQVLAGLQKKATSCDVNSDGFINVVDVQLVTNQALGLAQCTCDLDLNGRCDIVDIQRVIIAALGGSCRTGP